MSGIQESTMKRRKFLQTAALASVVAVTKPNTAFGLSSEPATFLPDFELEEMTITQLQAGMTSGRFSSKSLVAKYLDHISDIDRNGPKLNSVIELNPEASAIAERLDDERKAGRVRGPLHGIPIFIKDNIDTADRMTTTAGSLALLGSHRTRDSFVAQKLREAGAVLLGKTNMSEWANFRSSKSTSGWSARGGQTRNPYILDRNPCGSSSGSGVAPAANLCAAAIGTETDGSVVCPSSANSLVGIKPTIGLVSRSGIIPIAHSQDTAGPMTRTVEDAAILLAAITGLDSRDTATKLASGNLETNYRMFLDRNGLRGARIGVARKYMGFNQDVDKLMEQSIAVIKQLGAVIVDPADIPTAGQFDESELEVLLYEFKADLNSYLAAAGSSVPVHSLKEIIEFNEKNRDREMPFFGQDLFIKAQAKGPLTSRAYLAALRKNHLLSRSRGIDFVIRKHRLDAMIAPTGSPAWPTDLLNGDHFTGGYSSASAVAGYPHITVPAGYVHGLPVGLSFFAGAWTERKLITYAYAFEQATKARKPPKFLKTAQVG
jgi:amidase